ncbi:hypothetical protein J3458_022491 [Metarhizium acridum]|uniref:uncharacterized protein n=1 Tax=Metarhizium acridum TaxID=92637 RepID=UPI001C6B1F86|nr:hypothetical protein J3458_022491 [Metarhizium acridum]
MLAPAVYPTPGRVTHGLGGRAVRKEAMLSLMLGTCSGLLEAECRRSRDFGHEVRSVASSLLLCHDGCNYTIPSYIGIKCSSGPGRAVHVESSLATLRCEPGFGAAASWR